jgi:hypothetical protein
MLFAAGILGISVEGHHSGRSEKPRPAPNVSVRFSLVSIKQSASPNVPLGRRLRLVLGGVVTERPVSDHLRLLKTIDMAIAIRQVDKKMATSIGSRACVHCEDLADRQFCGIVEVGDFDSRVKQGGCDELETFAGSARIHSKGQAISEAAADLEPA